MPDLRIELKVCEGCGGLWMRAAGGGVYCRGCNEWLRGFPAPRSGRRRRAEHQHRKDGMTAVLPQVHAVAQICRSSTPDPIVWINVEAEKPALRPTRPENVSFYRKYTEAMCRRYVRLSMEMGRAPGLLGRELFRGNVSSCKMTDFSDVSVFCMDMERLIARVPLRQRDMVARIALQEYTQGEAAGIARVSLRTALRIYHDGLDALTALLLEAGMLQPMVDCTQ